jgi:hypothetical protein
VERQQHSAHPISLLGEQERRDAAGGAQEGGQDAGGRRGHVRRLLSACPPAQHPEVINFTPNFFIRAPKTLLGRVLFLLLAFPRSPFVIVFTRVKSKKNWCGKVWRSTK